ncbi:hypothetical protein [Microbacterium sp. 2FI]|uniref:hypothetical protein n=1 Tax=Microbacterium sp. 2FI TaxID=2502193 RepID=UPI0010F81762|nr:hypothetical protein [Microbacterium sp. 2FI]
MRASRRAVGGATSIIAATAALVLVGGSAASAHHCYKDQWQDAAYQQHLAGGTAWLPLSDMGKMFLIPPELQESCGYVADDAVAAFMAEEGMTQEPLIHAKATVGGGAVHHAGKEPKPFSYLTEDQFGWLTVDLLERLEECAAA